MKEFQMRKLLEQLAREIESNSNRKILGIRNVEEYKIEKESLIEDVINKLNNLDIAIEIDRLNRGFKWKKKMY